MAQELGVSHQAEIDAGRAIKPGDVTAYRCKHNHVFLVRGPHVFCRCNMLGWRSTERSVVQVMSRLGQGRWRHAYAQVLFCPCGTSRGVKDQARFNRKQLAAASAAFMVGGYAAAAMILKIDPGWSPSGHTIEVDDYKIPADFPIWDGSE